MMCSGKMRWRILHHEHALRKYIDLQPSWGSCLFGLSIHKKLATGEPESHSPLTLGMFWRQICLTS